MAILFNDLKEKYGETAPECAGTGINAQISKDAMKAYCRLNGIQYVENMEINKRISVSMDKKYVLYYTLVDARRK